MIRIAVVDDHKATSRAIKKALEEYNFKAGVEVDAFVSGADMLKEEIKNHYNIVVMDIELSAEYKTTEENGMYLARKIKETHPDTAIIYITGTMSHVTEVLQYEPFRYINKPFEMKEICAAVSDAMRRIINSADQTLFYQVGGITFGTNMKRVKYFESNRRKIMAHTLDETIEFYEKMNDLEKRISDMTEYFIRAGKSYLVNVQHIRTISKGEIELYDGTVIKVTRSYKEEVMYQYKKYTMSHNLPK